MKTIVVNTLNGAVTEYDWPLVGLSRVHGVSAGALVSLGGSTDAGVPISAVFATGLKAWGSTLRKFVAYVYFTMFCEGQCEARVITPTDTYVYPVDVRSDGASRAVTGRGIRENYLAFGFANVAGAEFRIDAMEPMVTQSANRRV